MDQPKGRRPDTPRPDDGRVPELDALRGLAAVAVVTVHAQPRWLGSGWVAVDFFFVLSGYLITGIVLRHGGRPGFLRAFFFRRGLRVWPIYYLTVGLVLLLNPWLGGGEIHPDGLPTYLTFTQNVTHNWSDEAAYLSANLLHTWTLAIEEQFYVVWPAVVVLLGRRRGPLAAVALAIAATSVYLRSRGTPVTAILGRADGLALGGLLALILDRRARPNLRSPRLAAGFAGVAAAAAVALVAIKQARGGVREIGVPASPGLNLAAYNLLFFGVVGLVVCRSGRPWLAPLRFGPLLALGRLSYGLYLYHFVLMGWAKGPAVLFPQVPPAGWRVFAAGPVALLAAWLSWRYVERPILGLKGRFPYDPSAAGRPFFRPLGGRAGVEAGAPRDAGRSRAA